MDILNKPINSFSFNDIVAFCQEGHREGIQLDYKRDLPNDGLSKYFAAFSNTRGGVIILGVEENRQTGVPSAWNGIPENAQSVERVHQWASSVDPLPLYDIHATNTQNGNFFILVRIFEGDRTPYYVQNDARVYVRTGNITPSVDIASPDMLELLFGKKQKAEIARTIYSKRSEEIYNASLNRAERERLKAIAIEKDEYVKKRKQAVEDGDPAPTFQSRYYQKSLGSEATMCSVLVQPYFPKDSLIPPQEIKAKILEIRNGDGTFYLNFPALNPEPILDGVMTFDWGATNGEINSEQIYSTGLVRLTYDVLRVNEDNKLVYISHIASLLFSVLKATTNFYKLVGYQGGLIGQLTVDGIEGISLNPVFISRGMFPSDNRTGLMSKYVFELNLDTSILNDNNAFQDFYVQKVKEIYWSLGFGDIREETIVAYLRENKWSAT